MKKFLLSLFSIFCFVFVGVAQQERITGKVVNDNGEPIVGVSIIVKGTNRGTTSGSDGSFTISFNKNKAPVILTFSFIGYQPKSQIFSKSVQNVKIVMEEDIAQIDEVVVVGYGGLKRSEIATSVSSIKEAELKNHTFTSIEQALQGRVAGVSVIEDSGEPGSGINVSVRGINSLSGSGAPLYVIDGVPLNVGDLASGSSMNARDNPLSFMNPEDIASIEVLKDAAATSIYGSRGSNGVILITTKQASTGKVSVNFSAKYTYQMVGKPLDLMDAWQYATVRNEEEHLLYPWLSEDELYELYDYKDGPGGAKPHPDNITSSTDVADALIRNSGIQTYQLNISGGSGKNTYMTSFGYMSQDGIIIASGLDRYNFKAVIKNQILPRVSLRTNFQFNYSLKDKAMTSATSAQDGVINNIVRRNPLLPLTSDSDELDESGDLLINPYTEAINSKDRTKSRDMIGSVELVYDIGKGFVLNMRVGGNMNTSNRDVYFPVNTRQGQKVNGMAKISSADNANILTEHYLNYSKVINRKHSLNLVGGISYEHFVKQSMISNYENFSFRDFGTDAIDIATSRPSSSSDKESSTLQSGFMRLNYVFDKRYFINLSGRADGSSKFGAGNKWGYFPSGALAWRFSNERFFQFANRVMSEGKLRVSYGIVGNQSLSNYNSLLTYSTSTTAMNGSSVTTAYPSRIANPNLKWETTRSLNLGMDLSFLDNKFSMTVDVYKNVTKDLLNNKVMPWSSGYKSMWVNLGSIENRGIEVEVMAHVANKRNFSYNTRLNISHNKSILLDLGGDTELTTPNINTNIFVDPSHRLFVGKELGLFYGFHVSGLVQLDDFVDYLHNDKTIKQVEVNGELRPAFVPMHLQSMRVGEWKFEDVNNDGSFTDADKGIIGKAYPDVTFGWTHNFTLFRRWEISAFFQAAIGFQLLNISRAWTDSGWRTGNGSKKWYENRWTLENQHNDPRYPSFGANNQALRVSDALIEDGDYLKLKSLSVRYNIPSKIMSKIGLSSGSVYVNATNLITWTKYSGSDPEVNSRGGNILTPGIDNQAYPRPRTLTFGINLSF